MNDKSSIIQIDLKHVQEFLNEQERGLFMALLQTMDGKRRIEELAPHDWTPPEKFEAGMCSACNEWPLKTINGDGDSVIQCSTCGRKVEGDERAKTELEAEWLRMNTDPNVPAGAHVNPCSPDASDTVNPTAGEPNATHNS